MRKIAADHDYEIIERPELEDFFHLCMLEIGDPTAGDVGEQFHDMRHKYFNLPPRLPYALDSKEDAAQLLSYILWYQREKDRIRDKQNS